MTELAVAVAAAGAFVAALTGPAVGMWVAVGALVAAVVTRRPIPIALAVVVLVGARAHVATESLSGIRPANVDGVAQLVSDPQRSPFGTSVVLRLGGHRWMAEVDHESAWVLDDSLTGDRVRVTGRVRPFSGADMASRRAWILSRHLAGRLSVERLAPGPETAPWYRFANFVHRRLSAGTASFDDDAAALFMGLVVGDDRAMSSASEFRFRASGMSHLTAVSGQNVAFLLAVFGPVLGRVGLRYRWIAVIVVLAGFVLVTRGEPSVLRAVAMAAVAVVAVAMGRVTSGTRVVSLAVLALLVVDPMLAHSAGFRLSLAATIALLCLARPIALRLPGPRWFHDGVAVTLAAQLGTTPLLLSMGERVPAVATATNILAVPAAGMVMTLGLTAGLVAGLVRDEVAVVLNLPARALVAWIDTVATVGSRTALAPLDATRLGLLAAAVLLAFGILRVSTSRAVHRLVAMSLVGAMLVTVVWPMDQAPGRRDLPGGVDVYTGGCGGTVVVVGSGHDAGAILESLWTVGVVRAATVVASSERPAPVTFEVAEQLRARVGPLDLGRC